MSQLTRAVLAALCLAPAGCVVPYAYPKVSYIPPVDSDLHAPGSYAFRVDATAKHVDIGETAEFTLTPIGMAVGGPIPPQLDITLESGTLVWGPVTYTAGRAHTTRVRLYRPGYQLIELAGLEVGRPVRWESAADWSAQERAVDDLITCPAVSDGGAVQSRKRKPATGTDTPPALPRNSAGILNYASLEYERVAALATPDDADRLREKARKVRQAIDARP
jgi:hypothetical protein